MYVALLQTSRGNGRDTLSYGMADKDTHPHHYLLPLPSGASASASSAPSSSPPPPLASSSRHQHQHHRLNHKPPQQIRSLNHHNAKPQQISQIQQQRQEQHSLAPSKLKQVAPIQQKQKQHDLAKPKPNQHDLARAQQIQHPRKPQQESSNHKQQQHGNLGASSKQEVNKHGGLAKQKWNQQAQQQIGASTSRNGGQAQISAAKHRSFSDDDTSLSPKKKKLKLIVKLRKPGQEAAELPPTHQGVGSKVLAPKGSISAGLGSPNHGSSPSARASPSSARLRQPDSKAAGNGTAGSGAAAAAAGGPVMELRQRSATTSASPSESVEAAEAEGLHSSRKRKVRDFPERKPEEKAAASASAAADEGEDERRVKEKLANRSISVPVPGQMQHESSVSRGVMEELLERFQKKDTYGVFAEPVDPEEIPDYLEIIKEPMDFSTIKKKLTKGAYSSLDLFERDVNLICSNAMKYNAPKTIYYKQAKAIRDIARKAFDSFKGRLNGQRRTGGKPSSKTKRYATKRAAEFAGSDGAASDAKRTHTIDRVADLSHKTNSPFQNSGNDYDFSEGSLAKSLSLKDGRRLLTVDENRRNTYRPPEASEDDVLIQLIPFGYQYGGSYAQSLALFGANFNRRAWEFVARKIRKVLGSSIPFGPGWVGEQEPSASIQAVDSASAAKEVPREESKDAHQTSTTGVTAGILPSTSAPPSRMLSGSTATPSQAPNGLFSEKQNSALSGQSTGKHWIQNAPSVQQVRSAQASQQKQFRETNPQQVASVRNDSLSFDANGQHEATTADGNLRLFPNRTSDVQSRKQDAQLRTADINPQQFRNVEATTAAAQHHHHSREAANIPAQFRKSESSQQQLRNGDSSFQQAHQSRTGIDMNSQQLRDGIDGSQMKNSIDVNVQQPRNSSDSTSRSSMESSPQQARSFMDVNSQHLRQTEAAIHQQLGRTDVNQYRTSTIEATIGQGGGVRFTPENQEAGRCTGPKFGNSNSNSNNNNNNSSGSSIGFTGIDPSRGVWSLQRALAQESALRDGGGSLQRVFGQEQVTTTTSRSSAEAAAAQSSTFPNLSSGQQHQHQLFQLPGFQGKFSAQSRQEIQQQQQQQHQHQHQQHHRHISDLNSRSDAELFRQQQHQQQQANDYQQQKEAPQLGVYNVISQSLLQPWKSQQRQQQQSPSSLRQLPPDLNVRLQSPKSPQQQHHQQQHHQQQQQQHHQQQQPDLALQL